MKNPCFLSCEELSFHSASPHWSGFKEVSFCMLPGSLVVVQGKSGSGKSVLLKCLVNEIASSSGRLAYGNMAVKEGEDKHNKPLFIKETDGVQLSWRVHKQLRYYAKKCDNLATVDAATKYFNLQPLLEMKCKDISEGYRRRLLFSQLLFSQSKLWLLDDAFKGLDEEGAELVQALVQARTEQGGCVIMSAHNNIANPKVAVLNMDDFQADSTSV